MATTYEAVKPKAVIFDFDGVIINSIGIQKKALIESYEKVVGGESPPSFDEFLSHSGDSLTNIFKKMSLPLSMIGHYHEVSRKNITSIEVFEGIRELLTVLKMRNFLCGIFTGKDRVRTIEILNYHDLLRYFDIVVCSDDISHPKPHPQGLIMALEQLGVPEHHALMVGDAPNDIRCAKAANVQSVGVLWGETDRDMFILTPPDSWVSSVDELRSCILKHLS